MSASDLWRTPPALFAKLDREFHFTVDLAADRENHLLPHWFGPGGMQEDALATDWQHVRGWMNNPYSNTGAWVQKAFHETRLQLGLGPAFVVGLIPYMPSERWWWCVERAVEVRRIPHRIKFYKPDGTPGGTARFPSAVVVWKPQPGIIGDPGPRYVTWDYR